MELPGESVPPLMIVLPSVPVPPSLPPAFTVTVESAIEPFTIRVPPSIVVAPVYVLLPVRMSVPGPALLSAPAPEMAAASVSVSVKLATIWPSLAIAGVTIAPARPPTPRLSVLPAPIDVAPGELTTPPSATVSVPSRLQPQLVAPIASELNAFKTEPAPVTIKLELPLTSPMIVDVVELTTPPLAMMSAPGPTVTSPTKRPKGPPKFQVEPGPVTVAVGVPRKGRKVAMSALPWLLSTPALLMVTDAGAKLPMIVCPVTVTLEPAPVITALPATPKLVVVSVPPLVTVSVPPSTMVEPPTVSEPPLIVSAGLAHVPQSVRSRPMVPILPPLLAPVSVSEAMSSSSSEPAPANAPENVLLLLPTMLRREKDPIVTVPPPASDPISTKAPLPTVRAAPALTVKAGANEELLLVPPVMVKVAPF